MCDRSIRNVTVETNVQICFAIAMNHFLTTQVMSKLCTFTLKHISLDLRGLNKMLNPYVYSSQMLITMFKASADGANNTISSA